MTPEEAIEQNKQWLKEHPHLGAVNGFKALPPYEAIQLGIEALVRLESLRDGTSSALELRVLIAMLLPSETE